MSVERSGQALHVETSKGQLATGGARGFGARAAALDGWYEPDESRGSGPEFCEGLGVKFPGPTRRGNSKITRCSVKWKPSSDRYHAALPVAHKISALDGRESA
jgi:hypothetical protein